MINRMLLRTAGLALALTFAGSAFAASQTQTHWVGKTLSVSVSRNPLPAPDPWEDELGRPSNPPCSQPPPPPGPQCPDESKKGQGEHEATTEFRQCPLPPDARARCNRPPVFMTRRLFAVLAATTGAPGRSACAPSNSSSGTKVLAIPMPPWCWARWGTSICFAQ